MPASFNNLTTEELLSDLPLVIGLYGALKNAIAQTKGQSPVERDFNIVLAVLPSLKSLAVALESQLDSPAPGA